MKHSLLLSLFTLLGVFSMNADAAERPKIDRYLVQFDSEGYAGFIKINGILIFKRDGITWVSGGGLLNPLMKKGENVLEIEVKELPTHATKKIRLEISQGSKQIWAFTTMPKTGEFKHKLSVMAPEIPETGVWTSEPVKENEEDKILLALNQLSENLKKALAQKDAEALLKLTWEPTKINYLSMGIEADLKSSTERFKEMLAKAGTEILTSAPLDRSSVLIVPLAGSNLFVVSRRDKKPVVSVGFKNGFSSTVRNPVMGRKNGRWQILGDSEAQ